jgi:hypothetical protein
MSVLGGSWISGDNKSWSICLMSDERMKRVGGAVADGDSLSFHGRQSYPSLGPGEVNWGQSIQYFRFEALEGGFEFLVG